MTRTVSKSETSPEVYEPELAQFHIGIHIGGTVIQSASTTPKGGGQEAAKLKMLPMGLLVEFKGERVIVSYSNCVRIKIKS